MGTAMQRRTRNRNGLPDRMSQTSEILVVAFDTSLRWMALACAGDALSGLVFGQSQRRDAERALAGRHAADDRPPVSVGNLFDAPDWAQRLAADLQRYSEGERVEFRDTPLEIGHLTPFSRRVVEACRRIPWGRTRSYGELAASCGSAGAARAVGSVMARNRFPLVVPCHRVLGAGGAMGGYSAPDGIRMKRRLLALEGSSNDASGLHAEPDQRNICSSSRR